MKSKKLIVAFVALLALSVSARESDGLYFDLKCLGDANDNGRLDLNEAVNAMAVGVAGGHAGQAVAHVVVNGFQIAVREELL